MVAARYQSLADDLRRRMESGEFQVGKRLPAEAELAFRFRVSVPTIRVALDMLQAEGRVEKIQGSGNFVRQPHERTIYDSERHASDQQTTQSSPLRVKVEVHTVNATSALATLLQVRRGSLLTEFILVSFLGAAAQSMARLYVPQKVAKLRASETALSPWGDDIRELLAAAGVHVASTVERVTSRLPNAEEKHLFRSSAPMLAVERTSTDTDGRVVEGALLVLPGDRAQAVFATRTHAKNLEEAG
ncbi:GntR family transcriptional regulator [Streptomyces roseoverticillatus]|uniref:GntR family transcriptional regulator n=1 Tax=Streptomyces roseoverticillatus TaxID=66429 RepID=UPI001F385A04|nr:GntR family transcriptional regulator [Streptomyces roseoverticillatus]MCF3102929.1 GntR family transcriptional regulator [Streptomyces roseoverticillatus]